MTKTMTDGARSPSGPTHHRPEGTAGNKPVQAKPGGTAGKDIRNNVRRVIGITERSLNIPDRRGKGK